MRLKCIQESTACDLVVGKIYQALASRVIGKTQQVTWYKVKDESGDTYWYPEPLFEIVK